MTTHYEKPKNGDSVLADMNSDAPSQDAKDKKSKENDDSVLPKMNKDGRAK